MTLKNYFSIFYIFFILFFGKQETFGMNVKIKPSTVTNELKKLISKGFSDDSIEKVGYDGGIKPFSFIAYNDDAVVGVIIGKIFWNTVRISQLYIFPNYRHQGIGRSLVTETLNYAKENNCKYAFVETMNFQAVDFYKNLNFVVEFERFGFSHNTSMYFLKREI